MSQWNWRFGHYSRAATISYLELHLLPLSICVWMPRFRFTKPPSNSCWVHESSRIFNLWSLNLGPDFFYKVDRLTWLRFESWVIGIKLNEFIGAQYVGSHHWVTVYWILNRQTSNIKEDLMTPDDLGRLETKYNDLTWFI